MCQFDELTQQIVRFDISFRVSTHLFFIFSLYLPPESSTLFDRKKDIYVYSGIRRQAELSYIFQLNLWNMRSSNTVCDFLLHFPEFLAVFLLHFRLFGNLLPHFQLLPQHGNPFIYYGFRRRVAVWQQFPKNLFFRSDTHRYC